MFDPALDSKAERRRAWLATLARASARELEEGWRRHSGGAGYTYLRRPEIGLVMIRGRAGGTGQTFNLGEMTVTRCAVRITRSGAVGFGYVGGREPRRAELVAAFDALLQAHDAPMLDDYLEGLRRRQSDARIALARKIASTRVEFFTMARGG